MEERQKIQVNTPLHAYGMSRHPYCTLDHLFVPQTYSFPLFERPPYPVSQQIVLENKYTPPPASPSKIFFGSPFSAKSTTRSIFFSTFHKRFVRGCI